MIRKWDFDVILSSKSNPDVRGYMIDNGFTQVRLTTLMYLGVTISNKMLNGDKPLDFDTFKFAQHLVTRP